MNNKVSAYSLIDILESSVARAQESIKKQYEDNIKAYFNEDNTPKTINMNINNSVISVPEICLANLRPITPKSVNIIFECGIGEVEENELMLDFSKEESGNKISINIVLNSENIPESIMRINDRLISEYLP